MKNCGLIFILFVVELLVSCYSPQDTKINTFKSNEIIIINSFVTEYQIFPPEIKLSSQHYYNFKINDFIVDGTVDSNNLKQGYWKINDLRNKIFFQGNYINDKKNGWWETFSNGMLICCGNYELDKKQGYWKFYGENKANMKFVNFKNDTLDGVVREYADDSILVADGSYINGLKNNYWKLFYTTGVIKEQGYYHDGFKSGWWQSFNSEGKLIEEASYSRDEISGYVKRYSNGILLEEGKQFNGKKEVSGNFMMHKENKIEYMNTKMNKPNVVVIIPAYNEENSVAKVIRDIPKNIVSKIIVVNNNSNDSTRVNAQNAGAIVLDEPAQGYGNACLKGIAFIKELKEKPDIIVFIDADYSDYPEEIEQLIEPIIINNVDLVIGSRALGNREAGSMTVQQIFGNWLATTLIKIFYKVKYTDLGPFRAIKYDKLITIDMQDKTYGWTVEMQLKAAKLKLKVAEISVRYRVRIGHSKISGTLKGTIGAGYKIITTIFKYL